MKRHLTIVFLSVLALFALVPTAQAAVNYFDATKNVTGTGTVSCGSGWKVTGGGYSGVPLPSSSGNYVYEYFVTGSSPYSNGWKASVTKQTTHYWSDGSVTTSKTSYSPKVYAVCTQ